MTVILANGDFPKKGGEARRLLASATRIVACDGAADRLRRIMKRDPSLVVGDLDSISSRRGGAPVVRIAEQETNDLAKAVRVCAERGWENPVVLGATGRRDDHTLGNIFRVFDFGLEIVTDFGRFIPIERRTTLKLAPGSPVSVFATDPETKVTSKGLEWPLDGVEFRNLYCATLNRAAASRVTLDPSRRIYVYLPF